MGENLPAHRLLGPVQAGLSGILPLGPDVLTTFVLNYAHQLNHPNPLNRASARWGLMCALWQLSLDMPCVLWGLADCDCHPTDHDCFLRYTRLMDIRVWAVRERHHVEVPKQPLGTTGTASEADDAHADLAAGYMTGHAPAGRGGHHVFVDRKLSPRGPRTCSGPGSCNLRALPCEMYRTRRFSYRAPLGTPTTRPVVA